MPATIQDFSEDEAIELAKAAHLQYLNELAIFRPEARANVAWEALDPTFRALHLGYVRSLPRRFELLGLGIVTTGQGVDVVADLTPEQVTAVARAEHERWCRMKFEQGYELGPEIDEWSTPKTHSDLVPFDDMTAEGRNFPLTKARGVIALLGSCGFEVVRAHA